MDGIVYWHAYKMNCTGWVVISRPWWYCAWSVLGYYQDGSFTQTVC